jgi:hypothetical protein
VKFSDIQQNPLNYDKDVLGGKIEAYFTVTLKDCLFIDQLTTHKLDITLTEETTEPTRVAMFIDNDPETKAKRAYLPKPQQVNLYNGALWNEHPAFSTDFLQKVMCGTTSNEYLYDQIRDAIASRVFEAQVGCTADELNRMFGGHFEDSLKSYDFAPTLHCSYRFLSTTRIEVESVIGERVQLIKSQHTNTWKLEKEISERLLGKLKADCEKIKNYILEQPREIVYPLGKTLPEELIPYLRKVKHIGVTFNERVQVPTWLMNHKDAIIHYEGDFSMQKRYELDYQVPVNLSYDGTQVIVTLLIEAGESLKPAKKAMDVFQNQRCWWNELEARMTKCYAKDLLLREIAPKRHVIQQLISNLDEEVLRFVDDDGVEYALSAWEDSVSYERDDSRQWIFIKKEDDFDVSFEYSSLLSSALYNKNVSKLKETIKELVDKF